MAQPSVTSLLDTDYFSLLGLPVGFQVDEERLAANYYKTQSLVHPDKLVGSSPAQKQLATHLSGRINEAYQTLKNPLSRAKYLLRLREMDVEDENNTTDDTDFLMQQLQWRERLEDSAGNIADLRDLLGDVAAQTEGLVAEINELFNDPTGGDDTRLLNRVSRWQFLDKLATSIEKAVRTAQKNAATAPVR